MLSVIDGTRFTRCGVLFGCDESARCQSPGNRTSKYREPVAVGDPFKDTANPSLKILIKRMAVVSLVIAYSTG